MKKHLNPSVWEVSGPGFGAEPLTRGMDVDVCVVGAGIAGMTAAYLLARQGRSVVVLDSRFPGAGETAHTTAHLSNAIDARYFEMARIHGIEGARLIAESHSSAIDKIDQIVMTEGIPCEFERVNGYLFNPPSMTGHDAQNDTLDRELKAAHAAGLRTVEKLDEAPIPDFDTGTALLFPRQAQFHPLKYIAGLRAAFLRDGGKIYGHTLVKNITGGKDASVKTEDGRTVRARHVIVATNSPFNDLIAVHVKQTPYRTYVIGFEVPKGSVRRALFWDTADPYHYARIEAGETADLLLVGGEDHVTGQADDAALRFARLERWTLERFPAIRQVRYRWSGQTIDTVDGIAYIGRNPMDKENVYIATGDCGMGMTHGTIAGMLLSDMILGIPNRWEALYDPTRKWRNSLAEVAKHNLNVAARYGDYVTPGDVADESEILIDGGAVIREGLRKVAVYKDEAGICHHFSAVCPHLRCIVHWNTLEKTWDCPCHGSRFSATGEVLNGPAAANLEPQDQPAETTPPYPAS